MSPKAPASFLRQPQVLALVPFSHATLWRHVKQGTFPAPLKISERVTAWRREDVETWVRTRIAAPVKACVKRQGDRVTPDQPTSPIPTFEGFGHLLARLSPLVLDGSMPRESIQQALGAVGLKSMAGLTNSALIVPFKIVLRQIEPTWS
jgi:predicted DNA-binding transcriptional regulator AlpA